MQWPTQDKLERMLEFVHSHCIAAEIRTTRNGRRVVAIACEYVHGGQVGVEWLLCCTARRMRVILGY